MSSHDVHFQEITDVSVDCPLCRISPSEQDTALEIVAVAGVKEFTEHLSQDDLLCSVLPRCCLCMMLCGWDVVLLLLHCWTLFGHSAHL